ncbi:hypothetical protein FC093_22345 [Ilyomonas limi]|uniref:Uncharacterized protein n=1 Tax=Ilyomonas limi TaxID=2575867 RepID=A0A4U3KSU9_9BACT|nr:DUF6629 family protein [Ilyomonas limi]TKK64544.1 hypothetical protein FC093_22345 [Ilyomonas limi]
MKRVREFMCFSASASFGASAVLGIIGIGAVKKAGNSLQSLFACIPLIFCVQQLAEGFVWLSFTHTYLAGWQPFFIHFYLLFAYVLWPVVIPLSIMVMEKDKKRKSALSILLMAGSIVASYILVCMFLYPVRASVIHHHIAYLFNYPLVINNLVPVRDGLYFTATLLGAFVSSQKKMWMFGTVLIMAYLFSKIFYKEAVASVWCYFAAVLSVVVIFIIQKRQQPVPGS